MKKSFNITLLTIIFSSTLVLTGCNTVKGAFQGAGEDAKSVSHELQLDNSQSHSTAYHYKKKKIVNPQTAATVETDQSTTTTTTTTTTAMPSPLKTPSLSPSGD